jgi:uncharacterized membrane protein YsdA (DUF1294 family)
LTRSARKRRRSGFERRPYHYGFGIPVILATVVLYWLFYQMTTWNPYFVWIAALSVTTAGMFILDKVLSKVGNTRIPELLLHLFSLAGGFPGQMIGMGLGHKSNLQKHPTFLLVLFVSLVIHGLLYLYWFF